MRSHEFTPEDKPDKKTIQSLEKHYSGYQPDDEDQIYDYSSGDYGTKSASRFINKPLGKEKGAVPPNIAGAVAKLDAATARHVTPREITVYYGTGPRRSPDIYKYGASVIKGVNPKNPPPYEMINYAYSSTSLDSDIADLFLTSQKVDSANYQRHRLDIRVPKGFRGAYIGHKSAMLDKYNDDYDELEFILPRGTKFTILPNPKIKKFVHPREPGVTHWIFTWQAQVANTAQQGVAEDSLHEVLNTVSTNIKWKTQDEDLVDAVFTASNGLPYVLSIMAPHIGPDEINPYEFFDDVPDEIYDRARFVEFEQTEQSNYGRGKQGIEGTGNAAEIFGIVTNALLKYTKKYKPSMLYFQAAEPNRQRLYTAIAKRMVGLLPGWGIKQAGQNFVVYDKKLLSGQGVAESASGYIPSDAEKNDPRFKTALTVDIKPDTMKKDAKKFGNKISRAGIPPTLKANGKF